MGKHILTAWEKNCVYSSVAQHDSQMQYSHTLSGTSSYYNLSNTRNCIFQIVRHKQIKINHLHAIVHFSFHFFLKHDSSIGPTSYKMPPDHSSGSSSQPASFRFSPHAR